MDIGFGHWSEVTSALWHYSNAKHTRQPGAQSSYDLLLGMRGQAVTLLFLDSQDPEKPVHQVPGFVEGISSASITLGLAAPLPRLGQRTRFGVELRAGSGILRFQTLAAHEVAEGETHVELELPRQIESVQRRKFSRAPVQMPVAFSPALDKSNESGPAGGIGHSVDLSGGGLRMYTSAEVRPGDLLFVSFNTPDGASFRGLAAKVSRVQADGARNVVALTFVGMTGQVESQLVQTVFRLQLKEMSRR